MLLKMNRELEDRNQSLSHQLRTTSEQLEQQIEDS
jgi:hypothetical protein